MQTAAVQRDNGTVTVSSMWPQLNEQPDHPYNLCDGLALNKHVYVHFRDVIPIETPAWRDCYDLRLKPQIKNNF